MTYLQILNTIKDTALAQPNVNSVVREFLDLNREDAKYSAVVIQDRDGSRDRIVEQDYVTYTWHLGYVDRLTYDESNRNDIISTGINIINNIVNIIRNTWFPELEVSIVDRINTFDQRFTAQCAGVYVVLAVNAQVSDCIDSESTDLYDTYDAKITANGVYHFVPSGRPVDEINITVDIPVKEEVSLTDTVTMNGIHTYIPEENTVYKDVELTVDVHPTERLVQTYTTNGVKTITGEFNGGEITVDVDTVWGSITGNITDQTDLVDYVAGKDNEIKSWVSSQGYLTEHQDLSSYALKSEIPSLDGYATESWVTSQGYITSIPDTFATKDWVSSQSYLTSLSLTGYATESWVTSQGYITSIPDTFATKDWVSSQGYLTSISLSGYATESWVSSQQFATQSWVSSQGYLTSTGLSGYATQSWVSSNFLSTNALNGYVTESWVESKGYLYSKNSSGDKIMNFNTTTPSIYLRNTVSQQLNINPWLISMYGSSTRTMITPNIVGTIMGDDFSYKVAGAICDVDMSSAVLIVRDIDDYLKIDCHNIYTYSGGISNTYPLSEITSKGDLSSYATQSWVSSKQFATQSWVTSQGYTTQTYVDDKIGQIDTLLDQMLG